MYSKCLKRVFDFCISFMGILFLFPVLIVLTIIGAISMKGNPFFFQLRPGKDEKIFKLIKFRTMTQEKDAQGNLLPDDKRLTKYGLFLRKTSLDELPELFNILIGDMAVIGPRPQLVRDMVFMTDEQRQRHQIRPGLTGLAQVNGRNAITWEQKLSYDLEYLKDVSLKNDISIFFKTIGKVLGREDINREGTMSDIDYGDWLLQNGKVTKEEYDIRQKEAKQLLGGK